MPVPIPKMKRKIINHTDVYSISLLQRYIAKKDMKTPLIIPSSVFMVLYNIITCDMEAMALIRTSLENYLK